MAERNLQREYQTAKARGETLIGVKVPKQVADCFTAKCTQNGTTKNAVLKAYILQYTYGDQTEK